MPRATERTFQDQNLSGALVLTSSANAVVPKKGSEAYDTSKAALHHLIRELAIKLGPAVRVNGIAPATVVAGSTMFPRDRVIQSLQKYKIAFAESDSTEELRDKLGEFLCPAHTHQAARLLPNSALPPLSGSPVKKALAPRVTSFRSTAACRKPFFGSLGIDSLRERVLRSRETGECMQENLLRASGEN